MNSFIWENRTKVYFGENAVADHLESLIQTCALPGRKKVLLGYGGGSIKKNGIYDAVLELLTQNGKKVAEISGVMPNPTLKK
ncbi:MAG: iron-containing alcohol dehydrogenase, partial [Mogibacterium sp.]|nr:iron-containing alcohol dehydrogenase [Mogibacterium sp.]